MTSATVLLLIAYACISLGLVLVVTMGPIKLGRFQSRFVSVFFVASIYLLIPRDLLPMHEDVLVRVSVPIVIILVGILMGVGVYRHRAEEFAETRRFTIRLLLAGLLFLIARVCLSL